MSRRCLRSRWRLPLPVTTVTFLLVFPIPYDPIPSLTSSSIPLSTLLAGGNPTNPPHLVSASINASTAMSGVEIYPEALSDSDNLTRILAQLTTMNTQLDSHEQRLAHLEKTDGAVGQPDGRALRRRGELRRGCALRWRLRRRPRRRGRGQPCSGRHSAPRWRRHCRRGAPWTGRRRSGWLWQRRQRSGWL
jgi:hypothetical protein